MTGRAAPISIPMKIDPTRIHRILFLRLSALGDCVAAIPALIALRRAFPRAHLAWAIQDNYLPLIQNLKFFDEAIVFPRRRWKETPPFRVRPDEALALTRHLRSRRFDLCVDIQSNTKSAALAFLSGARIRLGHGGEYARELSGYLNNVLVTHPPEMRHIVFRNLHLLSALGIEGVRPEFSLPVDGSARIRMEAWLRRREIEPGRYVVIAPFCGRAEKNWPEANFAQLADLIASAGVAAVMLHTPGKEDETKALTARCSAEGVFTAPPTSLPDMVELIRMAGAAAGGDTGPLQIAGALGVANVCLFGPTDPAKFAPWGETRILPLESDARATFAALEPLLVRRPVNRIAAS